MSDPVVPLPSAKKAPVLIAGAIYFSDENGTQEYAMCLCTRVVAGRTYGYLQRVGWKPLEIEQGSEESEQWTLHSMPAPVKKRGRPRKTA